MSTDTILAILAALAGLAGLINSIINSRSNSRNAKAVSALEEGKLDLSAAELGHDITMDLIRTLRTEVSDCHQERNEFRATLQEKGLLPK